MFCIVNATLSSNVSVANESFGCDYLDIQNMCTTIGLVSSGHTKSQKFVVMDFSALRFLEFFYDQFSILTSPRQ